jgi:hypothetical protein
MPAHLGCPGNGNRGEQSLPFTNSSTAYHFYNDEKDYGTDAQYNGCLQNFFAKEQVGQ